MMDMESGVNAIHYVGIAEAADKILGADRFMVRACLRGWHRTRPESRF
ncbi:hypothetical protein [Neorhizobium sp. T25_13]|nr:hypothetical protein [Neorhizobium sp. T25_13]